MGDVGRRWKRISTKPAQSAQLAPQAIVARQNPSPIRGFLGMFVAVRKAKQRPRALYPA
jgi:hypothetical protein